jgi:hypothetical protein
MEHTSMNPQIRQLIKTKSTILFPGTDTVDCEITDIEKFAELIVQECAQVLWNIDNGELHDEYVESLKKHFGIK